ncbi:type VII secretion-associated serine protease mycosin [Streptomyces sp. NPDC052396]|uniref:type VII secretion-associated serine protease mycosin n=1 Tax=Streptomyces sp. NPDC052396 TaxID=3365689 RepID=UPI0037D906B5
MMHADDVWASSTGSGITVAVIDSGVDRTLPDLQGQVLPGKDFSGEPGDEYTDLNGHGTVMAVLITGTGKGVGGAGTKGLAPDAKILPLRVTGEGDRGARVDGETSTTSAIRFAADSPAKIINISMGAPARSEAEEKAIEYAISKGKLIFASVGNGGQEGNLPEYPAAVPGVVGVGAIGKDAKVTAESERGPQVALVAPGDDMITTCPRRTGLCSGHGTSASTALASASAALVWSKHPDWTANQVLRVLINTAGHPKSGDKRNDQVGYGLARPRVALTDPGDPGPADIHPLTGKQTSRLAASTSPQLAKPSARPTVDSAVNSARDDGGGSSTKWIVGGMGAAALICVAIAVPFAINRRRSRLQSTGSPSRYRP